MASKKGSKKSSGAGSSKRTLIAPNDDKRFVKRDEKGRIKESDDVGKSLGRDVRQHAKKAVKPGYGDQGDQAPKKGGAKKSSGKKSAKKSSSKKR